MVVGYAGTGKSTMLGEARAAWEAEGYQVRGAALSGIAAEQLEAGAGIASRTVHSLLFQWEQGREALTDARRAGGGRGRDDRLAADGAAAVGRRRRPGRRWCWWAIRSSCRRSRRGRRSGRSPSGSARRRSPRCGGSARPGSSRRRASWRPGGRRRRWRGTSGPGWCRGTPRWTRPRTAMIAGWDAARRENPQARQIMLAYRRDDVRDLNERARAVRQAAGELGDGLPGGDGARGAGVCRGGPGVFPAERARAGGEERHARHGARRIERARAPARATGWRCGWTTGGRSGST